MFEGLSDFITHHLAKLNDQRSSRDVTYLICHVTLQDKVLKSFCDFIGGSCSLHRTILPSLVAIVIAVVKM